MRAKIDENMPVDAVGLLVGAGWDKSTVHEEHLVGAADRRVIEACQREGRDLFSLDLDFADIRRQGVEALTTQAVLTAGSRPLAACSPSTCTGGPAPGLSPTRCRRSICCAAPAP